MASAAESVMKSEAGGSETVVHHRSETVASHTGGGDMVEGEQLITVHTPSDEQQLIMVHFGGTEGQSSHPNQVYVNRMNDVDLHGEAMDTQSGHLKESSTQTETVFGLEDLPTVTEIVRKTIAKTKRKELEEREQSAEVYHRPVNGIYTCTICAKVYRNKISWQNHLASHNGNDVFMCGVCGQLFNIRLTLKAHLDVHIREEKKVKRQRNMTKYSADMKIGGVYMPGDIIPRDDEKTMTKHIGTGLFMSHDNDEQSYVAATEEVTNEPDDDDDDDVDLLESSPKPQETTNTVEAETESNFIYACNICGEQYPVKEDCERHLRVHTGGADPEPDISGQSGERPKTPPPHRPPLDTKLTLSTPNSPKAKFSAYIYACNVCGKQYTNKSNCKRHMRIHTDEEKLYECEYCGKRFSQKYEVKMHARIHTGEKPFTCAVCGKNFTERGNWRRHTQIHVRPQEASPYRCGICCKGFFHAEKLQVHLQIHSGQRPFVCTVCGRKVKKIGDMYRHLRTHTGEKPYKCQVCGKGFAQNGNLKDHMKMHTGEKPHFCDLCGKNFARKVLLKEHIKHHHKGTTLQDLSKAVLEEIERQEAEMETIDTDDGALESAVVHEITTGNVPKILRSNNMQPGNTIVIGGPSNQVTDEAQLLHEETELELQDVHATLTEKELEAAHVLTVVQDGEVYTYNVNNVDTTTSQQIIVSNSEPQDIKNVVLASGELEVQNS